MAGIKIGKKFMSSRNALKTLTKLGIFFLFFHIGSFVFAENFQIYSISQEFPMGVKNEKIGKNFYVNIGKKQGVKSGDGLDVFRNISKLDPYGTKKRYNHSVKIGELKVIHVEENSSICVLGPIESGDNTPIFDIRNLMIGDKVLVKVN